MNKKALPDLNELAGWAGKLFKDLQKSLGEIYDDYQDKHQDGSEKPEEEENIPTKHAENSMRSKENNAAMNNPKQNENKKN